MSTHREGVAYLKLVLIAAAIGIPAALVAALFLALVHELENLLWDDLPDQLGYDSPPGYLVIGLPVVGALIVILARRLLPGDGGNPPTEGMALQATPVAYAPGIALAAIGTLAFGAVLGPEAPVVALGAIVGVAATHFAKVGEQEKRVLSTAGSFSAISALFGGPLTAGMLLLEGGVGMGAKLIPTLLPGLVAAAVGYVIFTGFGDWGGLDAPGLVVPDLPAYKGTFIGDLLVALAVGVATAVAIAMVRRAVAVVEREGLPRLGMAGLLLAGGLAVGLLAQVFEAFDVRLPGHAVLRSERRAGRDRRGVRGRDHRAARREGAGLRDLARLRLPRRADLPRHLPRRGARVAARRVVRHLADRGSRRGRRRRHGRPDAADHRPRPVRRAADRAGRARRRARRRARLRGSVDHDGRAVATARSGWSVNTPSTPQARNRSSSASIDASPSSRNCASRRNV